MEIGNCCYIKDSKKLWLILDINKNSITLKDKSDIITTNIKNIKEIIEN